MAEDKRTDFEFVMHINRDDEIRVMIGADRTVKIIATDRDGDTVLNLTYGHVWALTQALKMFTNDPIASM